MQLRVAMSRCQMRCACRKAKPSATCMAMCTMSLVRMAKCPSPPDLLWMRNLEHVTVRRSGVDWRLSCLGHSATPTSRLTHLLRLPYLTLTAYASRGRSPGSTDTALGARMCSWLKPASSRPSESSTDICSSEAWSGNSARQFCDLLSLLNHFFFFFQSKGIRNKTI